MEIELLKKQRSGDKGRITYFKNQFESNESLSIGELQSMLHRLRVTYTKFDDVQSNIESPDTDASVFEERTKFEDVYGNLESKILNQINKLEFKSNLEIKSTSVNLEEDQTNLKVNTSLAIKLPEILLPKFDGSELGWLRFRDIFNDLIHTNSKLDQITKFHYLISCFRDGKSFNLIEALPVTSQNYDVAWKTIFDQYNNEVSIQKLHIKGIYDIKKPSEGSAQSLKLFIDTSLKHVNALKNMNVPVDEWNLFLIHHLCEKLDLGSHTQIIKNTPENTILKFSEFINILKKRVRVLESVGSTSSGTSKAPSDIKSKKQNYNPSKQFRSFVSNENCCIFCNGNHNLDKCPKFGDANFTPEKRFEFVKQHHLCTNCFSGKHRVFDCKSGACGLCALKHNILLYFGRQTSSTNRSSDNNSSSKNFQKSSNPKNSNNTSQPIAINSNNSPSLASVLKQDSCPTTKQDSHNQGSLVHNSSLNSPLKCKSQVLLATAIVWVITSDGYKIKCRALLDSGSQSNFITERMCQILKCRRSNVSIPVTGISHNKIHIKHKVNLKIKSRISEFSTDLDFFVLSKITGYLPSEQINFDSSCIPHFINLADPYFFNPDKIDLLTGAEVYHDIIVGEKVEILKDFPPFISSVFGYIVSGKINDSNLKGCPNNLIQTSSHMCSLDELISKIEKFWQIDEFASDNEFSIEEKICEQHYIDNVSRNSNGRYIVSLPIKSNICQLGESSSTALRQFKYLEQKLIKNPELYEDYKKFMSEYIELGHMKIVENIDTSDSQQSKTYYLPHHSVINENSSTTKVRVVFNASSKTSTNLSLNDCLMIGPTIQQNLFSIVLRFRKYPVALTGDITKMYRQILLNDNQQDLHRIWWRDTSTDEIKCYRMYTITYGTATAPFLATRTLKQLAIDEESKYPKASTVLKRDFYMDDVLTGATTLDEAKTLKANLISLLHSGGFELQKFSSNYNELMSGSQEVLDCLSRVLGMRWNTIEDTFNISFVKYNLSHEYTKRSVLSEIAQLFDPLGLYAPMVFIAKLFMQSLWSTPNLSWDEIIPTNMAETWNNFKSQLSKLENLKVPRCIISRSYKRIELHAFGDASAKGFGCAIYIRTVDELGNFYVRLLCAKSRVAPLKCQTIPRLELCAALLVAQITRKVLDIIDIDFDGIYLYSDSEITLFRIKSPPSKYTTFVANRVSQIQELTEINTWHYVSSTMNPADLVSRGLMPEQIRDCSMWWNGPAFLYDSEERWPESPNSKIKIEELELRKSETILLCTASNWNVFEKYSSYKKLLRVIATCFRFVRNCQQKSSESRIYGPIQSFELETALIGLVKYVQFIEYNEEIKCLRNNKLVSTKSKIKSLSPFIDTNGIVRVGGRLANAEISYDNQHPILLPGTHLFTNLLVSNHHFELLHAGPQSLLYHVRLRFWETFEETFVARSFANVFGVFAQSLQ